jgi:hypothetical protein
MTFKKKGYVPNNGLTISIVSPMGVHGNYKRKK